MKDLLKLVGALATALYMGTSPAYAELITYNFDITSTEGSISGMFSAEDSDQDGVISGTEGLSVWLMVAATGTVFTGTPNPNTLDTANAGTNLDSLYYALGTSLPNFRISAQAPFISPQLRSVEVLTLSLSSFLTVEVDRQIGWRSSRREITAASVTPEAAQVPSPAPLFLLAAGLIAMGIGRTRLPLLPCGKASKTRADMA